MMQSTISNPLPLLSLWQEAAERLAGVPRWDHPQFRPYRQNCLEHQYSVVLLARSVSWWLRMHTELRFDELLLVDAFLLHDVGEAYRGADTLYDAKSAATDVEEWQHFSDAIANVPEPLRSYKARVFLLQFARSDHGPFPKDAQEVLRELRDRYELEARLFDFIERLDYLHSACVGYEQHGNRDMIEHVVNNQLEKIRAHVRIQRELDVVWTRDTDTYFSKFL